MNNLFAKSDTGRLVPILLALCFAFFCWIPAAHARDDEESTKGQHSSSAAAENATTDAENLLEKPTQSANAEEDEATVNGAPLQQADPASHNVDASQTATQEHKGGAAAPGASLAEKATDPTAILTQLTNFFWTANTSDDRGIANTYVFQPILPLTPHNVLRPALPVVTLAGTGGVTGLGDLFLLDIHLGSLKNASWGVGPVATLPTATSDPLGAGKWSAGPVALYMYKGIPKSILGILAYNQWSFAGDDDRPDVNVMNFQPIVVRHFAWGYIGWTDQVATINWENKTSAIPLGVRFGKVWMGKTPINVAVQPYYTLNSGESLNTWGVKFQATLIMTTWLTH